MTLANFYAPNTQQDIFFRKIMDKLLEFSKGHLIMGEDLNVPLIPREDTSTVSSSVSSGLRKQISQSIHGARLVDACRLFHPGERDYSFFSLTHKVYSHIDLFFIPHNQLHSVAEVTIGLIMWSDHAPIFLKYKISDTNRSGLAMWKRNEILL